MESDYGVEFMAWQHDTNVHGKKTRAKNLILDHIAYSGAAFPIDSVCSSVQKRVTGGILACTTLSITSTSRCVDFF